MKVMTILGTRPEIIRLSCIIPNLDAHCEHILVNTKQSYDANLNDIFFSQLGIRQPNHNLNVNTIGGIITACEQTIFKEYMVNCRKPDRVLILGDTNTALSAIIARRMGMPVYHMEAGNRCYDDRVPEEINRRIVDHCSNVLMPYTERSRQNLIAEGIPGHRIYVTGNPMREVMNRYSEQINKSRVMDELNLCKDGYFLVTSHRQENVDSRKRLTDIITACSLLVEQYDMPVVFSLYPRTAKNMQEWDIGSKFITFHEPFGFFDFSMLEQNARCVITDSGTVQEECCILGIPNVTIRDVTERPETVECGGNLLVGVNPDRVMEGIAVQIAQKNTWQPPPEYQVDNVSDRVLKIMMGV